MPLPLDRCGHRICSSRFVGNWQSPVHADRRWAEKVSIVPSRFAQIQMENSLSQHLTGAFVPPRSHFKAQSVLSPSTPQSRPLFLLSCITQEKEGTPLYICRHRLLLGQSSSRTLLAALAARDGHETLMTSDVGPAFVLLSFIAALSISLPNDGRSHHQPVALYLYWMPIRLAIASSVSVAVPMSIDLSRAGFPFLYVRLGSRSSTRSQASQPDLRRQQSCSLLQTVSTVRHHHGFPSLPWV